MRTGEALAHGDPIEHALERGAGPADWIPLVGAVITLALMVALGNIALWRLTRRQGNLRYVEATAGMLLLWLLLGYLQNMFSGIPGTGLLLDAGYLVLPLALLTVWVFVLVNFRHVVREVLQGGSYLAVAIVASLIFLGFYLWSTNLVAPPEPDEMPSPGSPAFIVPFSAYGPLAIWPNVEFWIPQLRLFGAISVGTGLFVLTLAPMVGASLALLAFSVRRGLSCYRGGSAFGGVAVAALGSNFCCCCAPAIYPLLAVVFGTTAASSAAVWMVGSSSPLYNLTQVGTLSLTLLAIGLLARRIESYLPKRAVVSESPAQYFLHPEP